MVPAFDENCVLGLKWSYIVQILCSCDCPLPEMSPFMCTMLSASQNNMWPLEGYWSCWANKITSRTVQIGQCRRCPITQNYDYKLNEAMHELENKTSPPANISMVSLNLSIIYPVWEKWWD